VSVEPSVIIAILGVVSSLGVVVIANRYTARTARAAQETTAEIEEKKLDAASWKDQVESWRSDVKELREQRAADSRRFEEQLARQATRIDELTATVERQSGEIMRDRAHVTALVSWGRRVVALLREAGIAFPPPPPGVADTDPGLRRATAH
jgi:uncharacterized membrane-anchored protein YhcB (DUF1043 family)